MEIQKHKQEHDLVHLVHSDIVQQCQRETLDEFLNEYMDIEYDLKFVDIKHTYSMDWSPLSICMVMIIESQILTHFIEEFNQRFLNIGRVSLHRTIGVIYRSSSPSAQSSGKFSKS